VPGEPKLQEPVVADSTKKIRPPARTTRFSVSTVVFTLSKPSSGTQKVGGDPGAIDKHKKNHDTMPRVIQNLMAPPYLCRLNTIQADSEPRADRPRLQNGNARECVFELLHPEPALAATGRGRFRALSLTG